MIFSRQSGQDNIFNRSNRSDRSEQYSHRQQHPHHIYNNEEEAGQLFERELPSISRKIPMQKDYNNKLLNVSKRRKQKQNLKYYVYGQCSRDQTYYQIQVKNKLEQLSKKYHFLPPLSKPKVQQLQIPQKLTKQAYNQRQFQDNIFGFQHMGKPIDKNIIIQTQKDRIQKKQRQKNSKWIQYVLKAKQNNKAFVQVQEDQYSADDSDSNQDNQSDKSKYTTQKRSFSNNSVSKKSVSKKDTQIKNSQKPITVNNDNRLIAFQQKLLQYQNQNLTRQNKKPINLNSIRQQNNEQSSVRDRSSIGSSYGQYKSSSVSSNRS